MVPLKLLVGMISEGRIYEACAHDKVKESLWDSGRHTLYCGGCDETLYPLHTKVGIYYVSGSEARAVAEALKLPAKRLI